MYRYVALFGRRCQGQGPAVDEALRDIGLQLRLTLGGTILYASEDTPVLPLSSNGGALIGHVFSHNGRPLMDDSELLDTSSRRKLAHHVLDKYWGEYLLIQEPADDTGATMIMRDPSGGVGCVYSLRDGFATSDISIATRAGLYTKRVDWKSIHVTLLYPQLKTGRTGLAGLQELLPGCRLHIRDQAATTEQTWSPWDFVSPPRRHVDRHEAQADVRRAVSSTVKRWAETDESLLLELSGGLDSSIVAACLLEANARVSCCNLVTPVPGADERRYARLMSDLLRTELHAATLGFENARFDFPPPPHAFAPSTWFLQHASDELNESIGRKVGAKSFFSGGGGDTVFGYTRTAAPAADAFKEVGMVAGIKAIHDLAELHQCTFWKAGRLTLRKLALAPKPPRSADRSFVAKSPIEEAAASHPWFAAPDDALAGDRERIFDLAGTQVFRDGVSRGGTRQLRMPLLSQPVVEACLKVPSWVWITGGRNRALARDAFADILPPAVLYRRSKGTFVNYSGAVFRRNKNQLRDYLLAGELEGHGLLDADGVQRFFDRDLAARDESFMRIFDLCAVENWVRHQH